MNASNWRRLNWIESTERTHHLRNLIPDHRPLTEKQPAGSVNIGLLPPKTTQRSSVVRLFRHLFTSFSTPQAI